MLAPLLTYSLDYLLTYSLVYLLTLTLTLTQMLRCLHAFTSHHVKAMQATDARYQPPVTYEALEQWDEGVVAARLSCVSVSVSPVPPLGSAPPAPAARLARLLVGKAVTELEKEDVEAAKLREVNGELTEPLTPVRAAQAY